MKSYPFIPVRDVPIDPQEGEPFNARALACRLLRHSRNVALATIDRINGFPYSTFTNLSVEPDGSPVFYMSGLSHHGKNILADNRISITLAESNGSDVLRGSRLTLVGCARCLGDRALEHALARYRRKFFRSTRYLELHDTLLVRMTVSDLFLNGGPAQYSDDLRLDDIRVSLEGADMLMHHEEDLISFLEQNPDRLASVLSGAGGVRRRWRLATIDPEGMDFASEDQNIRIAFRQRITTPEGLLRYLGG